MLQTLRLTGREIQENVNFFMRKRFEILTETEFESNVLLLTLTEYRVLFYFCTEAIANRWKVNGRYLQKTKNFDYRKILKLRKKFERELDVDNNFYYTSADSMKILIPERIFITISPIVLYYNPLYEIAKNLKVSLTLGQEYEFQRTSYS